MDGRGVKLEANVSDVRDKDGNSGKNSLDVLAGTNLNVSNGTEGDIVIDA